MTKGLPDGVGIIGHDFEAVIGLEVHCQLAVTTKLFASCRNDEIDPVTLGLPGTLPVLNERAADLGVVLGFALGCRVEPVSIFARKNYFYPDLPKGYQITQYDRPLCTGGGVTLGSGKVVRLDRIQLEEDAGKTLHSSGHSLVDYRRAGVALLEIVSMPDMCDAAEASEFLRRLHRIVVFHGISDGNLEQGHFRADANVSIRRRGDAELGTRTELKNINSFRYVERAITLEIQRQSSCVSRGEAIVMETRGYDGDRDRTFSMRTKESAHDYRYFPDPDLPPLVIGAGRMERLASRAAVDPHAAAATLRQQHGLSADDAEALTIRRETLDFFLRLVSSLRVAAPKTVGSFLVAEVLGWQEESLRLLARSDAIVWLAHALDAAAAGEIANKTLKEHLQTVFVDVFAAHAHLAETTETESEACSFAAWAAAKGLTGLSDAGAVGGLASELLAEFPAQAEELRNGRDKLMTFFVGQAMKRTQGRVNAPLLQAKIREILGLS